MLKALRNSIIVKPEYEETRGKIIIPKSALEFRQYHGSVVGIVISVGPESKFRNELKPGDKVYWRRHEGFRIVYDRQVYFKVRDKWIMGKVVE